MYSTNHFSTLSGKEKITYIQYLSCTVLSSLIYEIYLAYTLKYIWLQLAHEWKLISRAITARTIYLAETVREKILIRYGIVKGTTDAFHATCQIVLLNKEVGQI